MDGCGQWPESEAGALPRWNRSTVALAWRGEVLAEPLL